MAAGKLRILQVMRAPVGGLFRHVADLTRWLDSQGHEVGLVVDSLANDSQTEQLLSDLLPHARLGLHKFAMPRVLGSGDLTTPFGVRKLARSLDIDIIHGHAPRVAFMLAWPGWPAAGPKPSTLLTAACCTSLNRPRPAGSSMCWNAG